MCHTDQDSNFRQRESDCFSLFRYPQFGYREQDTSNDNYTKITCNEGELVFLSKVRIFLSETRRINLHLIKIAYYL